MCVVLIIVGTQYAVIGLYLTGCGIPRDWLSHYWVDSSDADKMSTHRCLSSLFLKQLVDVADTTCLSRVFHILITLP